MSKAFKPHSYQSYSIQRMIDTPYIGCLLYTSDAADE